MRPDSWWPSCADGKPCRQRVQDRSVRVLSVANRVFLHVGLPKSGTTYLQAVLAANKQRLMKRATLLYPGERWVAQVHAARDVLSVDPHGSAHPEVKGAWERLVQEIGAWPGDAIVSMEWLGSADAAQALRMVTTLAPAEVHMIATIRDLGRTVPAAWQEFMQNWEQWTWEEFLRSITSENPRDTPASRLFWTQQDMGRLLAVWGDVLPRERIHVVTLPRPGAPPGELWNRFASVLGLSPGQYDASGGGGNESLGLESAELMRRLNDLSRMRGMDWPEYDEAFKHALAKRTLSERKSVESSLSIPQDLEPWVRARAAEMRQALEDAGVDIVGDLADLDPVFNPRGRQPDEVTDAELLAAALEGLVGLARDRARLKRRWERQLDQTGTAPGFKARLFVDGQPRPGLGLPVRAYRALRQGARGKR
jgi:hypothetical protein